MNLLQVISTTFRLYASHVGWYLFAGLMLFLASLVAIGLFSSSLLASMVLSIPFGEDGGWIRDPVGAILIFGCLASGAFIASMGFFATLGSFAHTCAQIGSGTREITILGFLEYARRWGFSFWIIGMTQLALGSLAALPFMILAVVLESVWAPLLLVGLAVGAAAFFVAQWPVWLAFSAQVVERKGVAASLKASFMCAQRAPFSALAAVVIWGAAFLVPTPMLFFYPLYFFFVFQPIATVMGLVYYESSKGMMR